MAQAPRPAGLGGDQIPQLPPYRTATPPEEPGELGNRRFPREILGALQKIEGKGRLGFGPELTFAAELNLRVRRVSVRYEPPPFSLSSRAWFGNLRTSQSSTSS